MSILKDKRSISTNAVEHIETIIEDLDLKLKFNGRFYVGSCPIHGGDNPTAFNLFIDGDTFPGYWCCYTHHCEEKGSGLLRLVQRVLRVSESKAIQWLEERSSLPSRKPEIIVEPNKEINIERENIRELLKIPAKFYLDRGFHYDILNDYDVGL